jgi:hypothetical protein
MEARKPRKRWGFRVGNPSNRSNPFFEHPELQPSQRSTVTTAAPDRRTGQRTAPPRYRRCWPTISPVLGVFYKAMPTESVLRIESSGVDLDRSAAGIEATKAHQQLEATTKAIRKGLPKNQTNCGAG